MLTSELVLLLVFAGMLLIFIAVLAIITDKYKKAEQEKKEDTLADAEEINQKILQMHDYGEFLSKELSDKQNEVMLMYEMLLDKEKKLNSQLPIANSKTIAKSVSPHQSAKMQECNSFDFTTEESDQEKEVKLDNSQKISTVEKFSVLKEDNVENHNADIMKLYAKGLTEAEIARQLQIGKGQVELVIRLFAKQNE